jgi:uncharacterized membrane protein
MNKYLKESILLACVILPYVYLTFIWNALPEKVPTHFNFNGVADRWSDKTFLLLVPAGLGVFIYLLMLFIPLIDPKKKIRQMGDKYSSFRFMLGFFFAMLSVYLLYVSKEGGMKNPNLLIALIGVFLALLGNYFQTVRPNYFIGIRTPWTLENEQVWKKTHHLGGRLWMVGGILVAALSFIINNNHLMGIVFGTLLFVMVIIPVVFSYTEFKKEKKMLNR